MAVSTVEASVGVTTWTVVVATLGSRNGAGASTAQAAPAASSARMIIGATQRRRGR